VNIVLKNKVSERKDHPPEKLEGLLGKRSKNYPTSSSASLGRNTSHMYPAKRKPTSHGKNHPTHLTESAGWVMVDHQL
jgi:hypothetical protein